ncbi:MAG: WYL domain-containing protein [Saccharospirillaceae bacterium]|nr:WYL domain-containing protein [Saccharospirillaceae bacterium]
MDKLTYSQEQRLTFIDFRLMFVGSFTRAEVVEHFQMGLSAATRDIGLYKQLSANNLIYDNVQKRYFQTDNFTALFTHSPKQTLSKLANQCFEGINVISDVSLSFESPSQLSAPSISIIAVLTQAVLNTKAVNISYISLSSGETTRTIIPHSIVDSGLRWHVRAYDLNRQQFRDFVITRMLSATLSELSIETNQTMLADHQWTRMVALEVVPHPHNIQHPKAVALDYGMTDGLLNINVRAALAGYLLRRWNIDCSDDASLDTAEYQLWLQNKQALYGVKNLHLASGYKEGNTNVSP